MLYLKPIIKGTGNYYIEAQTRDQTRTDVIVDYLGQQYILDMKVWRGERYNADGEKQIMEYLEYWNLDTGYMRSFNFNKKKVPGVKRLQIGGIVLFEGTLLPDRDRQKAKNDNFPNKRIFIRGDCLHT